ncbi:hypothetical protein HD806DRAFT_521791 [Xylariaceae sp. AK1471]|nr:hypothetical protein HD806DRAFT_521791 [Xylariaceae sp. AK1471]
MSLFSSGSSKNLPSRRPVTEGSSLYFAYGSNLHLTQMANRCPASVFMGKAVLPAYRWQINERGVANVIESIDDSVEGLLYLVNPRDEKSLDRSEGVARGFYQKHLLAVTFEPHRQFSDRKSSEVAQLIVQPEVTKETASPESQSPSGALHVLLSKGLVDQETGLLDEGHAERQGGPNGTKNIKALVYVSENYTTDGLIREEYILRMRRAMSDAITLGVSRLFVDKYITPFLEGKNGVPSTLRHAQVEQQIPRPPGGETSDDVSSKPKRKRMKAFQKHGGEISEKLGSQLPKGDASSPNSGDFHGLQPANRDPHPDSGI